MMFQLRRKNRNSVTSAAAAAAFLLALSGNTMLMRSAGVVEGTAVHVPSNSNHNGGSGFGKKARSFVASRQPPAGGLMDSSDGGDGDSARNWATSVSRGGSSGASTATMRRYNDDGRMPSLFLPEESPYDRYAACLAATEGLRRIRDRELAEEATREPAANSAGFASSGGVGGAMRGRSDYGAGDAGELSEAAKDITKQYVQNSKKVLRALGMTVNQFNEIGKRVAQDENLREKVMEQAYLYRMAATVSMDRMPALEDPNSSALLQAFRRDKVHLFCESMSEIERFRANQIERLTRSLGVDKFPGNVNISDPNLLPFLSPKVRAVVEAFPLQAEEIIKKHGLQSEEFNKMLEEIRVNPIFRWKIRKQLKQQLLDDDGEGGSSGGGSGISPDNLSQHRASHVRAHR